MYFLTRGEACLTEVITINSISDDAGSMNLMLQQEKSIAFPWNLSSKPITSASS